MLSGTLEQLNKAQLDAVSQTEGPMLIVAGAGTGKTKVITSRILYLLLDKKVPSSQVLALTFTEKATEEMISRVDEAMPLSYEEVTIKTFHGFCELVLRERGMDIGIDPGYRLLTQPEQWLFLRTHLFSFELDYYRPLGNPNKFLHTLLGHFSRLKDEDIQPDAYIARAEMCLEKAEDDVAKEDATKMLEVAKAYQTYQQLMLENNCLDFGDLQFYALRLFEKRPSVLQEFQNRFQYILVDEFQDTNYAQNKLVTQLAAKHQNITVVGDDDQSIYKWRGASLSNIRSFEKLFPNAQKVVLTDNYRSVQNLLDVAYHVVQKNNPDRMEHEAHIDKRLIARTFTEPGVPVQVRHYSHYLDEVRDIVDTIGTLVKNGTSYRDIALLVRANQHAASFVDALKDADVPFTVRDTQGLLRFEEVKDLVAVLRFLARPHDDVAFFRLLSLPLFDIPMSLILDALDSARKTDYKPIFYYLQTSLKNKEEQTLPGMEEASPFNVAQQLFESLLDFSRSHSVHRVLGEFLDVSGYVRQLTKVDTYENGEKIQHISNFLEIAKDFGNDANERPIPAFLEYIDSLQEAMGAIPSTTNMDQDAVSIMTVHAAKGLEFDTVFVPSLVNQRFPSTRRSDPIEIPQSLLEEELPEKDMHLQEERRLFYVACTRAKKELILSYSDTYEGRKKWKPSPFIAEVLESDGAELIDHTQNAQNAQESDVRVHGSLKLQESEKSPMVEKLSSIPELNVNQLSYSKIDAFKSCPLKYKFRYYFKIPTPQAHAANFGSSVHNTVNKFYEEVKAGSQPTLERLKELYEQCWIGTGYDGKGHEQARKKKGWEVMERFFAVEQEANFHVPAFLERPFRLKIGNIAFTGRIDRIDQLEDGTYEVVDYKTGTSKRNINLKKDLQLSLYALAAKEIFNIPVSTLSLYYLEDASKASTERSTEDLVAVKEELLELSAEMKHSDLAPTPGFHCGFCEYRVLCHAAA